MNELEQLKNFIHRRLTNITRPVIGSYCHGREDTLKELLEEINKSIERGDQNECYMSVNE